MATDFLDVDDRFDQANDSAVSLDYLDAWDGKQILNVEGNGLAAISALVVLQNLMDLIAKEELRKHPRSTSSASTPLYRRFGPPQNHNSGLAADLGASTYRPSHYFDFICGASFGGSCAMMLGAKQLTVEETLEWSKQLYCRMQGKDSEMFVPSGGWIHKVKDWARSNFLQRGHDYSGIDIDIGLGVLTYDHILRIEKEMCQTFAITAQEERKGVQRPFVLRSYEANSSDVRNAMSNTANVRLMDACLASLAVPSKSNTVRVAGLNGSFRDATTTQVNPALEAFNEVRGVSASSIECLMTFGFTAPHRKDRSTPRSRADNANDVAVQHVAAKHSFKFTRFADFRTSDASQGSRASSISRAEESASAYCQQDDVRTKLEQWAAFLVERRRQRAQTVRWAKYAGLSTDASTFVSSKSKYMTAPGRIS